MIVASLQIGDLDLRAPHYFYQMATRSDVPPCIALPVDCAISSSDDDIGEVLAVEQRSSPERAAVLGGTVGRQRWDQRPVVGGAAADQRRVGANVNCAVRRQVDCPDFVPPAAGEQDGAGAGGLDRSDSSDDRLRWPCALARLR